MRTVFLAMIMVRGQDVEAKALAEASRTSKRAGPVYGFLQSTRGCKLPSAENLYLPFVRNCLACLLTAEILQAATYVVRAPCYTPHSHGLYILKL